MDGEQDSWRGDELHGDEWHGGEWHGDEWHGDGNDDSNFRPLSGHAKEFLDELSTHEPCEMIGGPMDGQVVNLPVNKDEIEWRDTSRKDTRAAVYRRDGVGINRFAFVARPLVE